MIVRIVKITFHPDRCDDFIALFEKNKNAISSFKNCLGVELLRDINDPFKFFTYSKWESETDLNHYRESELFNNVWTETKKLFADKPEAWSVEKQT
jgi:heme-degrading monooxygenase HmoA